MSFLTGPSGERPSISSGGRSSRSRPLMNVGQQAMAQLRPPTTDPKSLKDLILFSDLVYKLHLLYPRFVYRDLPDNRVALGVPHEPTETAARTWDSIPSHIRNDVNLLLETPGPKVWLVSISRGWISMTSDLLTSGTPRRVIARSVYSILKSCVDQKLFTWEAAERVFGRKLFANPKCFIDVSVANWGRGRTTQTSSSPSQIILTSH